METNIDYTVFSDDVIRQLTTIIIEKQVLNESITILSFLNQHQGELITKKQIRKALNRSQLGSDKFIESLVSNAAITYQKHGTSYLYEITNVGISILNELKVHKESEIV